MVKYTDYVVYKRYDGREEAAPVCESVLLVLQPHCFNMWIKSKFVKSAKPSYNCLSLITVR